MGGKGLGMREILRDLRCPRLGQDRCLYSPPRASLSAQSLLKNASILSSLGPVVRVFVSDAVIPRSLRVLLEVGFEAYSFDRVCRAGGVVERRLRLCEDHLSSRRRGRRLCFSADDRNIVASILHHISVRRDEKTACISKRAEPKMMSSTNVDPARL